MIFLKKLMFILYVLLVLSGVFEPASKRNIVPFAAPENIPQSYELSMRESMMKASLLEKRGQIPDNYPLKTMEAIEEEGKKIIFMEKVPAEKTLESELPEFMQYMVDPLKGVPRINSWLDVVLDPKQPFEPHKIIEFNEITSKEPASLSFVVSAEAKFLPDFISRFIQEYCGVYTNETIFASGAILIQAVLFTFLSVFQKMCLFQFFVGFVPLINPYRFPWSLNTYMTEPFLDSVVGVFPLIVNIDPGPPLLMTGLAKLIKYIGDVSLTMPFLPSEGTEQVIAGHKVYMFSGIPALWKQNGVPNDLRIYWFDEARDKLTHYVKYYRETGILFVDDETSQAYQQLRRSQLQLPSQLQNFDVHNVAHSFNHFHNSDILINSCVDILHKSINCL